MAAADVTKPVLEIVERMAQVVEGKKDAVSAAQLAGHLAKVLRPRVLAEAAPVLQARNVAGATLAHGAASAGWPPPFAADKGMEQGLHLPGFAVTTGNGLATVHMRPIVHMGATAELLAYRELVGRLAVALESATLILSTLAPTEEEPEEAEPAAAEDEGQCDKTNGAGMVCLLDLDHEGDCSFPTVEPVSP